MIIALGSSIEGFKTLNFHKGLNILLAEQETNSEETKTRNSSGKSSVLELIHVNRHRNGTPYRLPKGTPASGCIGSARVGPELSI